LSIKSQFFLGEDLFKIITAVPDHGFLTQKFNS
jgi:hypothetical protein